MLVTLISTCAFAIIHMGSCGHVNFVERLSVLLVKSIELYEIVMMSMYLFLFQWFIGNISEIMRVGTDKASILVHIARM
jgi:hypothetical protein